MPKCVSSEVLSVAFSPLMTQTGGWGMGMTLLDSPVPEASLQSVGAPGQALNYPKHEWWPVPSIVRAQVCLKQTGPFPRKLFPLSLQ